MSKDRISRKTALVIKLAGECRQKRRSNTLHRGRGRHTHKVPQEPVASVVLREAGRGKGRTGVSLARKLQHCEGEVARKGAVSGKAFGSCSLTARLLRAAAHEEWSHNPSGAEPDIQPAFIAPRFVFSASFLLLYSFPLFLLCFYVDISVFLNIDFCLSPFLLSVYRTFFFICLLICLSLSSHFFPPFFSLSLYSSFFYFSFSFSNQLTG